MRAICIFLAIGLLTACSGDDTNGGTPDADDGDATNQSDGGGPVVDAGYPAITVDAPQVVSIGGPVLTAPKVQPIYFQGFDYATQVTDFTSKLGASTYWAALAEYKVGKLVADAPIALTSADPAPASITDAEIQSWLKSRWDGNHPEFGAAPDPSTIYAIFYPSSTTIYLSSGFTPDGGAPDGGGFGSQASCQTFGGYHGDVIVGTADIPYAVLPECPTFGSYTGADVSTSTASHELSEASTDPLPTTNPAYDQTDDDHLAWMFFLGGGEVGDMCAQFPESFYVPKDLGYLVQRNWSNASAKAGHDPCQPADATPSYFNTMPVLTDAIAVRGTTTKGVDVPVGTSKTIQLDLFSDGPTSGPWTVDAKAYTRGGPTTAVTFSLDKTSGQNGDKLNLTVTSAAAITTKSQTATLVITSTSGVRENLWIGMIGQQ